MTSTTRPVEEEAPGWQYWQWSTSETMPSISNDFELEDAVGLTRHFPRPRSCFPFLGGMWLSYRSQELLITVPDEALDTLGRRNIFVAVLPQGSITQEHGQRPYMCSGTTRYRTFWETKSGAQSDASIGLPTPNSDHDFFGVTAKVWGADLLDLPGKIWVTVKDGAGDPGGPLRPAGSSVSRKVWFVPTSPYVCSKTAYARWETPGGFGLPALDAATRRLRIPTRNIAITDNLSARAGEGNSQHGRFRAGERPGIPRKDSPRKQELGERQEFHGPAETAPLAWLRMSDSAMDRALGAILRGFEDPFKWLWVFGFSPYVIWRMYGGSSDEYALLKRGVTMVLMASFGLSNRVVSRALTPFKLRYDVLLAVVIVVGTAMSLGSFCVTISDLERSTGALSLLDMIVCVTMLGMYKIGLRIPTLEADEHAWRETCIENGVEFAEVGMPLSVARTVPDEMERDYAGTIGGSPWTSAVHVQLPSWHSIPLLTENGWTLRDRPLDNDEIFAEAGGRDRRKDTWLAAFVSATLMDPAGSISQDGAQIRLRAVLVLLAQNSEDPPMWASAGVTLSDLSHGWGHMAALQPWYDDVKDRTVILAHRGVGLALELRDGVHPNEMSFPLLMRPKEVIKWSVFGCDPNLLLRQPSRQATCRLAVGGSIFAFFRGRRAPRANNSLSSVALMPMAACAMITGLPWVESMIFADLQSVIIVAVTLFAFGAELWGNAVAACSTLVYSTKGVLALAAIFIAPTVCWTEQDWRTHVFPSPGFVAAALGYYVPAMCVALAQAISGRVWYPGVSGRQEASREDGLCHLEVGSGSGAAFKHRLLLREGPPGTSRVVPGHHSSGTRVSFGYYDGRPSHDHRSWQVVAVGGTEGGGEY